MLAACASPAETPAEAATAYIGECDCEAVTVERLHGQYDRQVSVVRDRHEGVKDDSLNHIEYLVVLDRVEGGWQVRSASFFTECRRAFSGDGLCN